METFLIPALVEWKEKCAARALAGQDPNASANEDGDEDEEEGDRDDDFGDGDGSKKSNRDALAEGGGGEITADEKAGRT